MNAAIQLLIFALDIYVALIIASIVVSWLVVFNVLNMRNKWVYKGCQMLDRATMPGMMYLRRFIPPMGGIDLTPMVLMIGIFIVQGFLESMLR